MANDNQKSKIVDHIISIILALIIALIVSIVVFDLPVSHGPFHELFNR